jgi:hypothetical protein
MVVCIFIIYFVSFQQKNRMVINFDVIKYFQDVVLMNEGLEITQLHSFCLMSSFKINKRQFMLGCFRTRHFLL